MQFSSEVGAGQINIIGLAEGVGFEPTEHSRTNIQ